MCKFFASGIAVVMPLCFDHGTGKQIWEQAATIAPPRQGVHSTNNFASASPCTDGRLYFHKGKSAAITCLDAKTGKPHFPATRVPGIATVYASPIAAGGPVYLTGRNGTTVVIMINDAVSFEIVATNSVGEPVDAAPAPAGDELFIRGEKHLFCIGK